MGRALLSHPLRKRTKTKETRARKKAKTPQAKQKTKAPAQGKVQLQGNKYRSPALLRMVTMTSTSMIMNRNRDSLSLL
jgi:hypothetical protein